MVIAAAVLVLLGVFITVVSLSGGHGADVAPAPTEAAAPEASSTPEPTPDATAQTPADTSAQQAARQALRRDGFPMLRWEVDKFTVGADGRMR